jgi:hypothetical protein
MNALQRASIEKAGHDNGWEATLSKDEESVTLGSSQHGGRVTVLCDAERLDVYNGLLLTANLDALFDQGLITFDDCGRIIISARVPPETLPDLGVCASMTLRHFSPRHQPYLAYHREKVYGN